MWSTRGPYQIVGPDINTVDGIYESNIKTRVTLELRVCLEM